MSPGEERQTDELAVWKALGHPIRQRIRRYLDAHGAATATGLAHELGLNTGTTSYHLRVLNRAGLVKEAPGVGHGKERWWQQVPVNLHEPAHDPADATQSAAADGRRSRQLRDDIALLQHLHNEGRQQQPWAGISRSTLWLTAREVDQFRHDYEKLLQQYAHEPGQRSTDSRRIAIRMFAIPD